MATASTLRTLWAPYKCNTSKFVKVTFPGDGRTWSLSVASESAPAWQVFSKIMTDEGYLFRESAGGTYNCRNIGGTNTPSLHSYGIALDLNPSKNPFGAPLRHNYPSTFIAKIEALRTVNDKRLFEWGGRWQKPDAMHWEIDCGPADIKTGIKGYVTPKPPPTGGTYTVNVTRSNVKEGSKGEMVKKAQSLLASEGYPPANSFDTSHRPDGIAGSGFDTAVRNFQKARGLTVDGVVGDKTWTQLEQA